MLDCNPYIRGRPVTRNNGKPRSIGRPENGAHPVLKGSACQSEESDIASKQSQLPLVIRAPELHCS
jgi:hypothetical protein